MQCCTAIGKLKRTCARCVKILIEPLGAVLLGAVLLGRRSQTSPHHVDGNGVAHERRAGRGARLGGGVGVAEHGDLGGERADVGSGDGEVDEERVVRTSWERSMRFRQHQSPEIAGDWRSRWKTHLLCVLDMFHGARAAVRTGSGTDYQGPNIEHRQKRRARAACIYPYMYGSS